MLATAAEKVRLHRRGFSDHCPKIINSKRHFTEYTNQLEIKKQRYFALICHVELQWFNSDRHFPRLQSYVEVYLITAHRMLRLHRVILINMVLETALHMAIGHDI